MIRSITEDKNANIYIASLGGLIIYERNKDKFLHLKQGNTFPDILSSNTLLEVFIDSRQRIWIGTLDAGLDLYLPNENRVINYSPSNQGYTLNHPEIETIIEDANGNIWIGTDNGLSKMDFSSASIPPNKFTNFHYEPLNEGSLLSNSIKIVYADSKGTIWVGSYYGGINVYNSNLYKFSPIRSKPWISTSLSHNNVTSFEEDDYGNLWIGMDGGGVNLLKKATENIYRDDFIKIDIRRSPNLPSELKVKTMKFDQTGDLWIGFWVGGLFQYNPATAKSIYYGPNDKSNSGLLGIRILDIEVDENNNLWLATFDQGISYFDRSTGKFKNYLPSSEPNVGTKGERFNTILIDSRNRIWAGGDLGGLNLYNEQSDAFDRVEVGSVMHRYISILNLTENGNGEICIGTVSNGLIIYNPATHTYKNFTERTGLPNNVIHAMEEDDTGNIWMGTNNGLAVLELKDSLIINYTKIDGLQGNQFNNGSSFQLSNGLMLFGGTNGWNAFYPDSISKSDKGDRIVFNNLWVNGNLVKLNDANSILTSHLNSGESVQLKNTQKAFTIEFAILDFDFSQNNRYAYLLEGFDTEWQYIGTDRKAVFNNMDPADYRLYVKATNHDGFWIEKPEPLIISIVPAWWQTKIFKISAIALFAFLVYLIFMIRFKILLSQRRKLEKVVEIRTQEIKSKNLELQEKNNEIQAQNEELFAQNEQIIVQREELEKAQSELKKINENLEDIVNTRTTKLEATIKQLDKTVIELDRFVYSASHDISAPLKSVKGLIEILKYEKDPDLIQDCIGHMIKSVESLEEVIKNLVDYSKNAHMEIEKTTVDCQNIIDKVISELKYWPDAKQIRYQNLDNPFNIKTDPNRLKIILHNLISNSIKYADLKKDDPFVKVECNSENSHWQLKVIDNGIGIDKEHLSKIFNMYYRASELSKGSGLGLFIVRESVSKLNGNVKVKSVKGEGTTFTLTFPI